MSLAPAERRALATIEDSLDRSDPRLARMLTRFTLPASWGGVVVLARSLRHHRPRIVSAVAVIAAFLFVLAVLHSPATPLRSWACWARRPRRCGGRSRCCPPAP